MANAGNISLFKKKETDEILYPYTHRDAVLNDDGSNPFDELKGDLDSLDNFVFYNLLKIYKRQGEFGFYNEEGRKTESMVHKFIKIKLPNRVNKISYTITQGANLPFLLLLSENETVFKYIFHDTSGTYEQDLSNAEYIIFNFFDGYTSDFITLIAEEEKKWQGKKWCVIGDSITEDNFRANKHYWSYINEKTGISVINKGISGTGYKESNPFYNRINASDFPIDCNIITIMGGINDIVGWGDSLTIGNPTDINDDTICGCVNLAIDALERKYPVYLTLGIISPLPAKVNTEIEAFSNALYPNQYPLLTDCRMEEFVTKLKTICDMRGYPFLDLYHDSGLRPWDSVVSNNLFIPLPVGSNGPADGLHPNEYGHEKIYTKIMSFMENIIQ